MIWSKVPRNALGRLASDQSGRCKQRELIRLLKRPRVAWVASWHHILKLRAQLYGCMEYSVGREHCFSTLFF